MAKGDRRDHSQPPTMPISVYPVRALNRSTHVPRETAHFWIDKDSRMIFANTLLVLLGNRKDMTVVIAPIGRPGTPTRDDAATGFCELSSQHDKLFQRYRRVALIGHVSKLWFLREHPL
jgi:hypothetical protein